MKIDVVDIQGKKVDTAELPDSVFKAPIKEDLMHQAYLRQLANARLGTHKTKTRSEVSGGGRKPWRQKGTGRARHGSIRSPIWVGGGVAHKPQPRTYRTRMPRRMRQAALRSALSVKAGAKQITVIDKLSLEEGKTREVAAIVGRLAGGGSALFLLSDTDELVERAARNLKEANVLHANYLNVRDLLGHDQLIIPVEVIESIEQHLGGAS